MTLKNYLPLRAVMAIAAAMLLASCASEGYGQLGTKTNHNVGFRETPQPDGSYVLYVNAGTAADAKTFWERRAAELCADGYEKNIYSANRPTVLYDRSGGRPGSFQLEGRLSCKAATSVPQSR